MSAKLDALLLRISTAIAEYLGVSAEDAETPVQPKKPAAKKPAAKKPAADLTDIRAAYVLVAAESPKAAKALKALLAEHDADRLDDLDAAGLKALEGFLCDALDVEELPTATEEHTETPKSKKPAGKAKAKEDEQEASGEDPEGMADLRDAYDLLFARDRRAARAILKDNDIADLEDAATLDDEGIETLTKLLKDAARKIARK